MILTYISYMTECKLLNFSKLHPCHLEVVTLPLLQYYVMRSLYIVWHSFQHRNQTFTQEVFEGLPHAARCLGYTGKLQMGTVSLLL